VYADDNGPRSAIGVVVDGEKAVLRAPQQRLALVQRGCTAWPNGLFGSAAARWSSSHCPPRRQLLQCLGLPHRQAHGFGGQAVSSCWASVSLSSFSMAYS
jgi:hypothetical protein